MLPTGAKISSTFLEKLNHPVEWSGDDEEEDDDEEEEEEEELDSSCDEFEFSALTHKIEDAIQELG